MAAVSLDLQSLTASVARRFRFRNAGESLSASEHACCSDASRAPNAASQNASADIAWSGSNELPEEGAWVDDAAAEGAGPGSLLSQPVLRARPRWHHQSVRRIPGTLTSRAGVGAK